MLPSMWRTELLHPLTVHFPIGLLIIGSLLYISSILFNRYAFFNQLRFTSAFMILVGTLAAWVANFTGGLAEEIVGSTLCDPNIRMEHEDYAYYTAYIFSFFVVFEIAAKYLSKKLSLIFVAINLTLAASGAGFLMYVGHLGATLVYQQGAGVYFPGEECKGFE